MHIFGLEVYNQIRNVTNRRNIWKKRASRWETQLLNNNNFWTTTKSENICYNTETYNDLLLIYKVSCFVSFPASLWTRSVVKKKYEKIRRIVFTQRAF